MPPLLAANVQTAVDAVKNWFVETRSVFTLDTSLPGNSPEQGVFNNWNDLWTAYSAGVGAADIYCRYGAVLPAGTFTFRDGSRLRGPFQLFDPSVTLTLPDGSFFENLKDYESVRIESTHTATPCLTFTENYPVVRLVNTVFYSSGSYPMVEWTQPTSTHGLNFDLDKRSYWTNNGNLVLAATGSGPGPSVASVNIRAGSLSVVSANTIRGNADSSISPQLVDGTGDFSYDQPLYSGSGSPWIAGTWQDVQFNSGLIVRSINIQSPSSFAPQLIFLGANTTTTDATPTSTFPAQIPPPVITILLDLLITAREAATEDSAVWRISAMIMFNGGGAAIGPAGVQVLHYDATPGAAAWTYAVTVNTPSVGQVGLNVIGEAGKTIAWNVGIQETIVLAF